MSGASTKGCAVGIFTLCKKMFPGSVFIFPLLLLRAGHSLMLCSFERNNCSNHFAQAFHSPLTEVLLTWPVAEHWVNDSGQLHRSGDLTPCHTNDSQDNTGSLHYSLLTELCLPPKLPSHRLVKTWLAREKQVVAEVQLYFDVAWLGLAGQQVPSFTSLS